MKRTLNQVNMRAMFKIALVFSFFNGIFWVLFYLFMGYVPNSNHLDFLFFIIPFKVSHWWDPVLAIPWIMAIAGLWNLFVIIDNWEKSS
jgi:hypothetical protein